MFEVSIDNGTSPLMESERGKEGTNLRGMNGGLAADNIVDLFFQPILFLLYFVFIIYCIYYMLISIVLYIVILH